jgi:hypothetical protein
MGIALANANIHAIKLLILSAQVVHGRQKLARVSFFIIILVGLRC